MRINTLTVTLVAGVFACVASADAGMWYYRPYEYEVWELQHMRAEAARGVLHVGYPGKWEEKPTIPGFAPDAKVVVGTRSGTLRFGGTSTQIQGMNAQPVWPKDRENEMNGFYRFRGEFKTDGKSPCVLRSTAAYPYRVRLNGTFAGYGPARAAPGFFRMDEWTLAVTNGVNRVEIEACAGNCGNFHFPHQVPFLQAEVRVGDEVTLATGRNFPAFTTERLRKVPRIALQRMFSEVYRLPNAEAGREVELAVQSAKRLLPRGYAYPTFGIDDSYRPISRERVAFDGTVKPFDNHIVRSTKPHFGLYPEDELEANPYFDLQKLVTVGRMPFAGNGPSLLGDCEAVIFEGAVNRAGFLGFTVECLKPCRLYLTYDEILDWKGGVDFLRLYGNFSTTLILERPGRYDFEAFVPTAFRYLRALAVGGEAEITAPYVRTYENPSVYRGSFRSSDPALATIFEAAQRTLAANAVDCVTDCPTRERAGWCGDTFFTGKACQCLTGDGNLERLFLSNWLMPDRFDCPADREGLIPAVYPVELKFTPGSFIPNFAMWFILEVEDYARRTGDTDFAKAFRKRLEGVVGFLEKFENSDGLLEKLPGWVFVEWSEANNLVQDVNYPSNMQYAMALDAMARMYGRAEWTERAKRIRAKVREQSWTGKWFCDNAVRQADGTLKLSGKCTETCQYYAFFSGVATREGDAALWKTMVEDFGAGTDASVKHPEVYPANFIFGRLIRLELLSAAGERARILREMRAHFLPMAEKTGTLWEHDRASASCCHGLASIAAVYLVRDVLGVKNVDVKTKTLTMSTDLSIPLSWCQAVIPVSATETVAVSWRKTENERDVGMEISDGWKIVEK